MPWIAHVDDMTVWCSFLLSFSLFLCLLYSAFFREYSVLAYLSCCRFHWPRFELYEWMNWYCLQLHWIFDLNNIRNSVQWQHTLTLEGKKKYLYSDMETYFFRLCAVLLCFESYFISFFLFCFCVSKLCVIHRWCLWLRMVIRFFP